MARADEFNDRYGEHEGEVYVESSDTFARFVAYSSPYLFWIMIGLIGTSFWLWW